MYTYQNQKLVIELPASSPADTHHALVNGIISTLKAHCTNRDLPCNDIKEGSFYLLQLLESLMPTVQQLEKLHVDSENKM